MVNCFEGGIIIFKKLLNKYRFLIIFITALFVILSGFYLYKPDSNSTQISKEDAIRKFYSCYEYNNPSLFNETVIDSQKVLNDEGKAYQKLFFDDILSFKLLDIKENTTNPPKSINGISYPQENIAEFIVKYEIDFDKNIYGTAGEGIQSVRKVIVRKDKNSPWLVAGQEGHGY